MAIEQPDPGGSRAEARPMSMLGWVLGALSLLNLIHDVGWIELSQRIRAWIEAYGSFVHSVGSFLFGWMHLGWISISPDEQHVLVIACVFVAAIYRAEVRHELLTRGKVDRLQCLVFSRRLLTLVFVPALVLPSDLGLLGSGLGLGFIATSALPSFSGVKVEGAIPQKSVRRELAGVGGVFLLLLAVNYSLFHVE